jgi:hypothetical protein
MRSSLQLRAGVHKRDQHRKGGDGNDQEQYIRQTYHPVPLSRTASGTSVVQFGAFAGRLSLIVRTTPLPRRISQDTLDELQEGGNGKGLQQHRLRVEFVEPALLRPDRGDDDDSRSGWWDGFWKAF